MEVKDRIIRFGRGNHSFREADCFIVDEYGIEDGEVYHRNITISEDIYEAFKKKPDNKMFLDEFLERNDISKEWKRYKLILPLDDNGIGVPSRLLDTLELKRELKSIQKGVTELSVQTKNKMYRKIVNTLSENETLIHNPLIIDVFNEALREDTGLDYWESVFPFFR